MSKWIRFNVFFEVQDDEDHDQMYDDISDAILSVIDPSCAALGDDPPPEGHYCTRSWTAGAVSMKSLDEDNDPDEWDDLFDEMESACCDFCGRPLPDRTHTIPTVEVTLE